MSKERIPLSEPHLVGNVRCGDRTVDHVGHAGRPRGGAHELRGRLFLVVV